MVLQSYSLRKRLQEPVRRKGDLVHPARLALNQRERDVLDLLMQYKTSDEIATRLQIPSSHVEADVEAARLKLGARSRAELALIYTSSHGKMERRAEEPLPSGDHRHCR